MSDTGTGGDKRDGGGKVNFAPLVRWVVFSLAIAVLPILLRYFALKIYGIYHSENQIFGDGGLLLVATAICADTIGDTYSVKAGERQSIGVLMVGGGALLTSIVAAMLWAAIATVAQTPPDKLPQEWKIDLDSFVMLSFVIFGLSVVTGAISKILYSGGENVHDVAAPSA